MEMDIGNTHIEIWDDYVIHEPEKIQEILERIGSIGINPKIEQQKCNAIAIPAS